MPEETRHQSGNQPLSQL